MVETQAKESWENAKYLIDAKKIVDCLWYISKNVDTLKNIDLHKKTKEKQREFYINCRIIIDKTFEPVDKKKLKNTDSIVKEILTEADQNYAHKDARYQAKPVKSWKELIDKLKGQLMHLRRVCGKALPENITLDFVPHDKELFRLVHKISAEDEEELNKDRHSDFGKSDPAPEKNPYPVLNVLHDIEQLKEEDTIQDPSKYGVIFEMGINAHEYLQNIQDSCITVNYIYDQKMWMIVRDEKFKWGRNEPCYCFSGKKYKDCCADVD